MLSRTQAGSALDRPLNFIDMLGQHAADANVLQPSVTVEFRGLSVTTQALRGDASMPTVANVPSRIANVRGLWGFVNCCVRCVLWVACMLRSAAGHLRSRKLACGKYKVSTLGSTL